MTQNEFLAKLIILGFKKERGPILSVYRHKNYNSITVIKCTVVYLNKEWTTQEDFDLLMDDIINGPKRINSSAISNRFQTSSKRLFTTS